MALNCIKCIDQVTICKELCAKWIKLAKPDEHVNWLAKIRVGILNVSKERGSKIVVMKETKKGITFNLAWENRDLAYIKT